MSDMAFEPSVRQSAEPVVGSEKCLLFTDIQRSTRLWADHTVEMAAALADHDEMVERLVADSGGRPVGSAGDGIQALFEDPAAGITAAIRIQRWLSGTEWEGIGQLRVRMGLHCGRPIRLVTGDYSGPVFNETARLHDAGSGGQVLVSDVLAARLDGHLPAGASLRSLGVHRLPDLAPAEIFQLHHPDLEEDFPPLRSSLSALQLVGGLSSFHGRERDVLRLAELGEVPALTITGPGGVGKTRLAQIVAGKRSGQYREGVAIVDLGSVARESEVAAAIATTLRIELSTSDAASGRAHRRTAGPLAADQERASPARQL